MRGHSKETTEVAASLYCACERETMQSYLEESEWGGKDVDWIWPGLEK